MAVLIFSLLFPATAHATDDPSVQLQFGEDGTFTIMLLSDTQDTQYPPVYLLRSIEAVLNNYEVDFIVLLGDQLDGRNPVLRIGNSEKNVERALNYILSPLLYAGQPFVFIYGSNDYEAPLSIEKQTGIYRSYSNCVTPIIDQSGAYYLSVYSHETNEMKLNLYFFESGPKVSSGYGAVSAEQVAWYRNVSTTLFHQNDKQTIPAIAFQHVPVAEIYELFSEVPINSPASLKRNGKHYLPDESRIFSGEIGEAPCPSDENYGLFDAFIEQGDVFLVFCGHDHLNSFIGSVRGIDLGSAPGSSYTSYGNAEVRGVRLLRFYEDDVTSYDTIHVRYSDFVQTDGLSMVRYYLSTTTLLSNAIKTLLFFLLLLTAIALIIRMLVFAKKYPISDLKKEDGPDSSFETESLP